MANQYVSKVVLSSGETLIDLMHDKCPYFVAKIRFFRETTKHLDKFFAKKLLFETE